MYGLYEYIRELYYNIISKIYIKYKSDKINMEYGTDDESFDDENYDNNDSNESYSIDNEIETEIDEETDSNNIMSDSSDEEYIYNKKEIKFEEYLNEIEKNKLIYNKVMKQIKEYSKN